MNGDAAEEVVKMTLNGVDVVIRLLGDGAKNLAALLIAWRNKEKKHVGKTSLPKLLTSGDELHVLSLTKEQYDSFSKQARKKITYAPFLNTRNKDGKVDIVLGSRHLNFANHILSRIGFGNVEPGSGTHAEILNEREKEKLDMSFGKSSEDSKKNDTPSRADSDECRDSSTRRDGPKSNSKPSVEKKLEENKRKLERERKKQKDRPREKSKNRQKSKPKPKER